MRSAICWRLRPLVVPLIGVAPAGVVGHSPSGGGGTFTSRCTKMPGVCTWSGSIAPAGTIVLVHLDDRAARGGRHHRTEIALRAVELQVAERIGARARG